MSMGGRDKENGKLKHINNTKPYKRGWLGNPYTLDNHSREKSIELFKRDFNKKFEENKEFREAILSLRNKKIACWCKPKRCHLEIIKNEIEDY